MHANVNINASMQRVARYIHVHANNDYTSASIVFITFDGIFVTRRGFCTLLDFLVVIVCCYISKS